MLYRSLLLAVLCCLGSSASAQTLYFDSPREQVSVVELFTSHGCSSCPPADAWLRKLVDHPGLWRQVVPLAFHVDYWDYLGWRDHLARPAFSQRQRDYQRSGALGSVYTPGVLRGGKEWRGWAWPLGPDFALGDTVGQLHLEVEPGQAATLRFDSGDEYAELTAHLAVLGFGIASPIGGGENSGRTLREDFVVLGSRDQRGNGEWRLAWPELKSADTSHRAVAAWVSVRDNPQPLQAVGGWLPRTDE